ncbi:MAG: ROK family protein [Eubacterium sp.]|nr:ROK family protein [Eubacterium sp.]
MKYYLGIDIGGTNVKAGVVDENAKLLAHSSVKTESAGGYQSSLENIFKAADTALELSGIDIDKIKSIGVGCPGTMDAAAGVVVYSNNLHWDNVPLGKDIAAKYDKKVYLENDANAAAYGEYIAGAAKGAKNAVVLTLGTGVGAGIIVDGKIYSGSNFAGGEIGHTVIEIDGWECTCGRKGCFEAYASATGLIRMTAEMIKERPKTRLKELAELGGKISARTAFNAAKLGDDDGTEVVKKYIKYLACGIANTINIFQPDVLCIGGGVCNEGDNLLNPLKKEIAKQIYTKNSEKNTEIVMCALANEAGMIGSAMLGRTETGTLGSAILETTGAIGSTIGNTLLGKNKSNEKGATKNEK